MEVNKRLRVSGSRGHEVFFKPLVANERPRKVRASQIINLKSGYFNFHCLS